MSATVETQTLQTLAETKRTDLTMVDPRRITVVPGFNTRDIDPANVATLKPLIASQGVLVPLTVVRIGGKDKVKENLDQYELITGHHRLIAVMELIAEGVLPEGTRVPVRLSNAKTDADKIIENYSENNQKANDFASLANAVSRLAKYNFTEEEIAAKLHINVVQVKRALEISASPEMLEEIKQGAISQSLAYQLLSENGFDAEKANTLVQKAKEIAKEEGKDKVTTSSVEKAREETGIKKTRTRVTEKMVRTNAAYKVGRLAELLGDYFTVTLEQMSMFVGSDKTAEEYATETFNWVAPVATPENTDNTESPDNTPTATSAQTSVNVAATATLDGEPSDEQIQEEEEALKNLGFDEDLNNEY